MRSNSVFWKHLSSEDSRSLQNQAVQNNAAGPIKLVWVGHSGFPNDEFLEIALPHSSRWKSALFTGALPISFPSCLSVPTPNLTDVYVYDSHWELRQHHIIFSEGYHLWNVDIEGASLHWGASRLASLRALSIRGLSRDIPTLSQLHSLLSSSPELWCLALSELSGGLPELVDTYSNVHLPNLSKLFLQKIPSQMTDFLLSHIESPNPMRLDIDDAFALPTSDLLEVTLGLTMSTATEITLRYDSLTGLLSITTNPGVLIKHQPVYMIDDQPGCSILLPRQPLAEYWEMLAQWLTTSPSTAIKLIIS